MRALKLLKEMNNIGDAAADVHGLNKWIVLGCKQGRCITR
jgi:hypothetical protein